MKFKFILIVFLIGLSFSCKQYNVLKKLGNGLIAYYPFNGNANDESGNGNNGVVNGAVLTNDRQGNAQSAYYFDGNYSYIDLGNSLSIKRYQKDFTVSGWIKLNQFSSSYHSIILSNRNHNTPSKSGTFMGIGGLGSSLSKRFEFLKNSTVTNDIYTYDYMSANTQINLNQWYFFCITYEYLGGASNVVKIYFNGNLESQKIMGETIDPEDIHTFLGCEPVLSPIEYSFYGNIDDIRIYNRVLNSEEVSYLYKN